MSMTPAQAAAHLDPEQHDVLRHESPRMRRDLPPAKMQLNLTSMIDVIFQLLIYFVITANFTMDEGVLTARLPEEGQASKASPLDEPQTPLFITIASAGVADYQIRLEGIPEAPNSFEGLSRLLKELAAGGVFDPEKKPIVIRPDFQVRWQHVVNAFNAAVAARYKNVRFAQATGAGG